jgi:DNA repair photolyase
MNFVADTYIGCPHACWYCYAPSFATPGKYNISFQQFRNFKRRFKNDRDFEKIEDAISKGKIKGTCNKNQEEFIAKAIENKHPLRIGSVSEPFGLPLEKEYGDTYKILEILIENNYPFVVCTKSPLIATPRYVNLLKSTKKVAVQISLISLNENLLKFIESRPDGNTPSAKSRLEALKILSEEGIFTICRIQPLIPQVTDDGIRELIFSLAEIGVKHIIIEFLWLPIMHAKDMCYKLKQALDEYCKNGGKIGDELRRYNNNLYYYYRSFNDYEVISGRIFFSKRRINQSMKKFLEMISEANREYNSDMTFGSGNEETTYLNSTENCCGVDRLPDFSGYQKCTIQKMLIIAKQNREVYFQDIANYYNSYMDKFKQIWKKRVRGNGPYFIEDRVFKLRHEPTNDQYKVKYVYDESAIPN